MRVLGLRSDGVILVDIGTKIAYAVDPKTQRYANLGDVTSRAASSAEWLPVARDLAQTLQQPVRHALARGTLVQLRALPLESVPPSPVAADAVGGDPPKEAL